MQNRRTTMTATSTYESIISHSEFPWGALITVGGGIVTLGFGPMAWW